MGNLAFAVAIQIAIADAFSIFGLIWTGKTFTIFNLEIAPLSSGVGVAPSFLGSGLTLPSRGVVVGLSFSGWGVGPPFSG